jgi:hypothetical protein
MASIQVTLHDDAVEECLVGILRLPENEFKELLEACVGYLKLEIPEAGNDINNTMALARLTFLLER